MKTNPATVLMVDDEPNLLAGYRRTVGRSFDLTVAEGPAAALPLLDRPQPFAVVISDMRMPGMNGLEFIAAARPRCRDTVFMMLTGNADQQTAVDAINQGQIFRFLNKPCGPDVLDGAIRAAIRQNELVSAERVLLRETVAGSIKLMMDALEMASPTAFGIQSSVKRIQQDVCAGLKLAADWQLGIAASLCLIGLVASPVAGDVTDDALAAAAEVGGRLTGHIPRLQGISSMIRRQREPGMLPDDLGSSDPGVVEEIGARVLRFAVDLARCERSETSRDAAVAKILDSRRHDARLVGAMKSTTAPAVAPLAQVERVKTDQVQPGMVLNADVVLTNGRLLMSRGQRMSDLAVTSLKGFLENGLVGPTVEVMSQKAA